MFSKKYGYEVEKSIEYERVSDELRIRIWNVFYSFDIQAGGLSSKRINLAFNGQRTIEMKIADKLGFLLGLSGAGGSPDKQIKDYILKAEWYKVFDFIDIHLSCLDDEDRAKRSIQYNEVLEAEKSGYRVVNFEISPITNKEEICVIEKAVTSPYDSVNLHISKALSMYSDSQFPDYENSIKESISAVESICCIITGHDGPNTSLGKTIKKLKDSGVHIHAAMENAFSSLYGYTSDETGIRHGGIDFKNAPAEDAKFMLVSCSAFVNYLIEKWIKVQNNDVKNITED